MLRPPRLDPAARLRRQKQDMTQDVLRYMGVPDTERERVQRYFDYVTAVSHPAAEGLNFLHELPKSINEDLHMFMHKAALKRMYLFQ